MNKSVIARTLIAGLVLTMLGLAPSASAEPTCAGASTGGDWAQHGGDLQGTRSQTAEDTIDTNTVTNLSLKWTTSTEAVRSGGRIYTNPVIAEGCVYIQTSTSPYEIMALNADTGELVWHHALGKGGCHNSPVVRDGKVYINVPTQHSDDSVGPHLLVLDAATGAEIVVGEELATEPSTGSNAGCAAPVALFEDIALIGITNGEMDGLRNGGYAVVDANTGEMIHREYVVPDDQAEAGFSGCSIWSAWSIDPVEKYAYTGTAQPGDWFGLESERCNAIIKVDLDQERATFGTIVGALKGTPDDPPYIDVDFGSAPTIATDAQGRQVVGMLQKSGVFHAGFTRHMTRAWSLPVSPVGAAVGNHTASASDGRNFFTVGAYPGQLFSINSGERLPPTGADMGGVPNWVMPVASPFATNAVAYANGVVYYGAEAGLLTAHDATNGLPLFAASLTVDNGSCTPGSFGGISIARNKIYFACGTALGVYGL